MLESGFRMDTCSQRDQAVVPVYYLDNMSISLVDPRRTMTMDLAHDTALQAGTQG